MSPPRRGEEREAADRVGRILDKLLDWLGIREDLEDQGVLQRWEEAVGERIAAVARPTAFHKGVLFVEVTSSAWLNELTLMKHQLRERINEEHEGRSPVEKLVFRLEERS